MREQPEKYPCEFSDTPPYEVVSTPWLTKAEVQSLKYCEDALDRLYNSGRFLFTLDHLINVCGLTPFSLFFAFGNSIKNGISELSGYAAAVYEYFKDKCDDADILREKIVCDLICCGCATQIPESLRPYHPLHKMVKAEFGGTFRTAVLEKSGKVFVCDMKGEKDLFSRLEYKIYDLKEFNR